MSNNKFSFFTSRNSKDYNSDNSSYKEEDSYYSEEPESNPQSELNPSQDKQVRSAIENTEDIYRRRGYFCATNYRECPYPYFLRLLTEHRKQVEDNSKEIIRISNLNVIRYREKIWDIEKDIATEINKLAEVRNIKEKLLTDVSFEEEELQKLKTDLYENLVTLSDEKDNYLKKKLGELEDEMTTITDLEKKVHDKRQELFEKYRKDNKSTLDIKREWLIGLKGKLEARYENLQGLCNQLDLKGGSPLTYNTIMALCYVGLIVSGWLFTVYTNVGENGTIGNPGISNVIITDFLDFIKHYFPNNPIGALVCLLSVLILIFLLSLACQWYWDYCRKIRAKNKILNPLPDEINSHELSLNISENDRIALKSTFKANSWLHFWLQIMPVIFIGCCMLVVSAFSSYSEKGQFVQYISSEMIGVFIAIALSAIFYVYMSNKAVSMTVRTIDGNRSKSRNWEIGLTIGAFIVFNLYVACFHFFGNHLNEGITVDQIRMVALVEFILISLTISITMGTIFFNKGVQETVSFLNWKINMVTEQILQLEGIHFLGLNSTRFHTSFRKLLKNVFDSLCTKYEAIMNTGRGFNFSKEQLKIWLKILSSKRKPDINERDPISRAYNLSRKNSSIYLILNDWEIATFPKSADLIKINILKCVDKEEKILDLRRRIEQTLNTNDPHFKEIEMRLSKFRSRKHHWHNAILTELNVRLKRIKKESLDGTKAEIAIRDGFDLGMWYRKVIMGPIPEFYQSCKEQNSPFAYLPSPIDLITAIIGEENDSIAVEEK